MVYILLHLHDVLDLVIVDIDPKLFLKLALYRVQLRRAIPRPDYLLPIQLRLRPPRLSLLDLVLMPERHLPIVHHLVPLACIMCLRFLPGYLLVQGPSDCLSDLAFPCYHLFLGGFGHRWVALIALDVRDEQLVLQVPLPPLGVVLQLLPD